MAEEIYGAFDNWRLTHRWVDSANVSPKGVVRDMWERAMDFPSFVRHYGLKRSEGTLLRYLSDAYRTITRTIPDDLKTPEIDEISDWLDGVIRATDSSLIDEWQALRDGTPLVSAAAAVPDPADIVRRPAALKALIRNRVFRWVQLASGKRWDALHEDLVEAGDHRWNVEALQDAFAPYFAEQASIGIGGDARAAHRFDVVIDASAREWTVHQSLADPEGFDEWRLTMVFDLDATERDAELRGRLIGLERL